MSEVILSVTGLEKSYDEVIAVAGLDFEIAKGECFGLLGPNGAGKSTLLDAICYALYSKSFRNVSPSSTINSINNKD